MISFCEYCGKGGAGLNLKGRVWGISLFFMRCYRLWQISVPFEIFSTSELGFIRCCKNLGVRQYAFCRLILNLNNFDSTFQEASQHVCLMSLLLPDNRQIVFFTDEKPRGRWFVLGMRYMWTLLGAEAVGFGGGGGSPLFGVHGWLYWRVIRKETILWYWLINGRWIIFFSSGSSWPGPSRRGCASWRQFRWRFGHRYGT